MDGVFRQLRAILEPYATSLVVAVDEPAAYSLDTRHVMKNKQPLFFGSAQIKKNYVSFYLMPIYVNPELLGLVSDGLRKRMQGKSCFNFKSPDEALFGELNALTDTGFRDYQRAGYV